MTKSDPHPPQTDPNKGSPVETVESCQHKILDILESVQRSGEQGSAPAAGIVNGGPVAKEIAELYVKMGEIYLAQQELERAAASYEAALQLNPHQWTARLRLLKTKGSVSKEDIDKAFLQGLIIERPGDDKLLNQLAQVHYSLEENEEALDHYQQAFTANPQEARNLYGIANTQQAMGDIKTAEESYIRAIKISPVVKQDANKAVPEFSVLMLFTPFVGNTPTEYLMTEAPFETNHFTYLPTAEYDMEMLKQSGQVIVNIVAEADQAHAVLPQIARLVDQLDMPVINHPAKVQKTTREDIAHLLRDIPGCRLAQITRHVAGAPTTPQALQALIPFPMPVLARPTGTHGGENFEKIDSLAALADFILQEPDADHYLIEYIDYQSRDGHFRKYRFIFVNDQIMPYHLAVGDDWKVHHNTTDMGNQQWMQDEEKAFLENPKAVFTPKNYQALRAIQKAVGLEYFGIDCGLDQAGNIVVFEVNATMLVHGHNEQFPYKTPFVRAIKKAFEEMLRKRVKERR